MIVGEAAESTIESGTETVGVGVGSNRAATSAAVYSRTDSGIISLEYIILANLRAFLAK